jgi:hypothetical protein
MRCLLNDPGFSFHCLDTSPEWTGARRIYAHQRWDNVDARPGETLGPSVGGDLRDELADRLLVSAYGFWWFTSCRRAAAESRRASARTRRQRAASLVL